MIRIRRFDATALAAVAMLWTLGACSPGESRDAPEGEAFERELAEPGPDAREALTPEGADPAEPEEATTDAGDPAPATLPAARPDPEPIEPERTETPADPEPEVTASVTAGTQLTFRVDETVSTDSHEAGDTFTATLASDVRDSEGVVALPAGASSRWIVTEAREDGGTDDQALLAFRLESVQVDGDWVPLEATVTETQIRSEARDSKTESAAKVAVGAAAGAVIGQIIGRNTSSTLKGAGVGAAVGTVVALTTRDGEAELAQGSTITVSLEEALVGYRR
jgi:hypothetical protein